MSFKVSFKGFTGHEESDADQSGEPDILEFDTEAERAAFIQGCNMTAEVTDGWVDAHIEVERIEEEPEPNHEALMG